MLDPQRVKLDAANIGFLQRTGQNVDYEKIKMFLQTDDSGCAKVRREADTPVNELHVMGGQRLGLEGNMNLQDYSRQNRQMNAYPLRSFSANNPVIVLPPKYGGFPRYTSNESERQDYVSRFTEPLSAPLQQNTLLLASQGYTVTNNSATDPFTPQEFEMNMFKSKDAIDYNEYLFRQKKYLQMVESQRVANQGVKDRRRRMGVDDGVFIGADGSIMTQVASVSNDAAFQDTAFSQQQSKARALQSFQIPPAMDNYKFYDASTVRNIEGELNQAVLEDNANDLVRIPIPANNSQLVQGQQFMANPIVPSAAINGMQPGNIVTEAQLQAAKLVHQYRLRQVVKPQVIEHASRAKRAKVRQNAKTELYQIAVKAGYREPADKATTKSIEKFLRNEAYKRVKSK